MAEGARFGVSRPDASAVAGVGDGEDGNGGDDEARIMPQHRAAAAAAAVALPAEAGCWWLGLWLGLRGAMA